MKLLTHALFFLLLAAQICFAQPFSQSVSQGGWFWQNPLPQGNFLKSVKFVSSEVGWAVGEGGVIIKTTNGGIKWNVQSNQTLSTLYSVYFTDENNGCAVGLKNIVDSIYTTGEEWNILGIILHTTNGGTTWTEQVIDTVWGELRDVCFTDANNGWVVGWELNLENNQDSGLMLHTTNGGATWNKQTTGSLWLLKIFFTDANNGWALGRIDTFYTNTVILKTTDGGTNWTEQTNVIGIWMGNNIFFNDINNGWAVGRIGNNAVIYRTTNGGTTWTQQIFGTRDGFEGVSFSDANNGWVVGGYLPSGASYTYGIILRTTNGGTTWTSQRGGIRGEVFASVSSPDVNNVSVVGGKGSWYSPGTIILRTTNGGTNWNSQTSGTTSTQFHDVFFVDEKNGWAVGGESLYNTGIILKTTNCGETWTEQTIGTNLTFRGVSFSDVNNGWVVGVNKIFHTTNGGTNWNLQTTLYESVHLQDVTFIDKNNGWTIGNYGSYRTTDGGNNWMPMGGCCEHTNAICFTDTNNGWSVGTLWDNELNTYGQICHTTNGGTTWTTTHTSGTKDELYSVFFTDANNGWAVGSKRVDNIYVNITYGLILHTTNGGTTWTTTHTSGPRDELYSVFFTDANNGWIGGVVSEDPFSGLILHTTDGGITWTRQINGTKDVLYSVFFTDVNNGWAVANNGTILHTTNSGVSFVEEEQIDEIPSTYHLSNNFPNPFNPSTKIQYSVPQTSQVQIRVFDVLGNEIETLISEEKPTGSYELTWNAANLPSGVYFYQLKAGSFIETKKMLLLK